MDRARAVKVPRWAGLVGLLAVGGMLAACGSDDAASSGSSAPVVTTAAPDATTVSGTTAAPPASATPTSGPSTSAVPASVSAPGPTAAPVSPAPSPSPGGASTVGQLLALGRPVVLAHAGGESDYPHSTPYAFAESVKAGVDVLDMDVQLTKDGVLVVQHDDTVDRTTDGRGRVADMTYEQLAALDNAFWFTAACTCTGKPDSDYALRGVRTGAVPPPEGYRADDFVIPRFRDIATRFPTLPLNIEIKGSYPDAVPAAQALAAELRDVNRLDSAIVTSFDDAVLDAFHTAAPEVEQTPGLQATSAFVLQNTPLPAGMRILQIPAKFNGIDLLTPDVIGRARAAGYVIWEWPDDNAAETAESYAAYLAKGVTGLNANRPATAVAAVKAATASS